MLEGTLLNEHSSKMTPNKILLYPETSESFSLHWRCSFYQWMASNTETHNCTVCREWKLRSTQFSRRCLYQTPCWWIYLKEKVKRLQGPKVVNDSRKQCSLGTAGLMCTWMSSQSLCRVKADMVPAPRRVSGHKVPLQLRSYLQLILLGKGKLVFLNGVSLVYPPHSRVNHMLRNNRPTPNRLHGVLWAFCFILFCLVIFGLLVYLLFTLIFFPLLFVCLFERERKNMKVGAEEGYDQNILCESVCKKNFFKERRTWLSRRRNRPDKSQRGEAYNHRKGNDERRGQNQSHQLIFIFIWELSQVSDASLLDS